MQARSRVELFFGASTLVRKWLAKMTKMAVLAKMAKKNGPNGSIFEKAEIQITTREYLTIKNADLGSSCGLRRALASRAL